MADITQFNNGAAYDGSGVEPRINDFQPLPAGEYACEITDACIKDTKAGNGHYVELTLTVIGDPGAGRKVWHRLNIKNPNPKAEEIGKEQLDAVREAVGLVALSDTDQLIGKYLTAKLNVKEWNGSMQNEVHYVKAYGAPQSTAPQAAAPPFPPPVAAPAAPPAGAMPWKQPPAATAPTPEVPF